MNKILGSALSVVVLAAAGCNRGQVTPVAADGTAPTEVYGGVKTIGVNTPPAPTPEAPTPVASTSVESASAALTSAPPRPPARYSRRSDLVLPPGTSVRVRLAQTIDTKRNRAGDRFSATLDEPLVVGDRVAVPRGTPFEGHVVTSAESGRFKGRAALALRLDSFSLKGVRYDVNTNRPTRTSRGHKKRNWLWIGGGSGGGAAIGAAAGGGAGALIGAGAGAAAGTVGAAFTGKRHVTLPVESPVTFALQAPVAVGT
jgi:hypothetical protein